MSHSTRKSSETKPCTRCGKSKPLSEYHVNRASPDGLQYACKECCSTARRAYYAANAEKGRADRRAYYMANIESSRAASRAQYWADPEAGREIVRRYRQNNPETIRASDQEYRLNNPEKRRAKNAVRTAVARGEIAHISTQVCQSCGEPAHHYHHPDYSRPLDVIPLCRICHKATHRQEGT